ncbi:MAG: hypothetical protein DRH10_01040 [Deltaproteobacteria bacterium]|nr:MAG: hypothetical protein DRH10_01040 [Deltaproteobacteria bacterium]
MADCECIVATVTEETIVASIAEEIIQASIVEEVIEASITEETIISSVVEETIQASIVEEVIEVSIEGWSCPPACGEGEGGKIELDFDFNDIGPAGLSLGGIQVGANVHSTFLEITEEFDNDVGFTIGTQLSQALLMRIDENSSDVVSQYMVVNNLALVGTENIRLFSDYVDAPTKGVGRATVYYH